MEEHPVRGFGTVPLYWVKFDKDGTCLSPVTADRAAAVVGRTDVFLMSHGWNNSWDDVVARYHAWIDNLFAARQLAPSDTPFSPLFIGVFWPSLVAPSPDEQGPAYAGVPGELPVEVTEFLDAIADTLPDDMTRLRELLGQPGLDRVRASEVAGLLRPVFGADDEQPGDATTETGDDVLAGWEAAANALAPPKPSGLIADDPVPTDDAFGTPAVASPEPASPEPATAGLLSFLPVQIARLGSVLVMKDRAGRVGGRGVAELLQHVLETADGHARVHLLGHSFGGKVVLAALRRTSPERRVQSILLLQPAISARCFAADAGGGQPGGYRDVLERSRSAILTTFSEHDVPLTRLFHLAARRRSDLIEIDHAAGAPKYGALGGFGPQRAEELVTWVRPLEPTDRYPDPGPGNVVAIEADAVIGGHGKVTHPATAWMLASQLPA